MKNLGLKALALTTGIATFSVGAPASASTVVLANCVSVASPNGCLFNGNINGNPAPGNANGYVNAQNAYNAVRSPAITLNYLGDTNAGFPGTFTGGGGTSGTWSLPGYLVNFVAVKAGQQFVLYQISPSSLGNWNTFDIPHGRNPRQLSHLAFFGTQAVAVPEPMTWAMMFAGFGMIGASMRRRGRPVSVTA